jgi:hypothetical protein
MNEQLQKKSRAPKRTLTELLNDKSVVTGREVIQHINDKEKLRKQFEEAVKFEIRNNKGKKRLKISF